MKQIIAAVIFILALCNADGFAQANKDFCSEIKFAEEQRLLNINKPARINVEVGEEFKSYKIKYLWAASGGKITRGQGTSAIELTPGLKDEGYNIFVTVKLDGLPENCLNTMTHTFAVSRRATDTPWFDLFGKVSKNDLFGRLDNYFVALRNDWTAEGLIVLEFDKAETRAKKIKRLNLILEHLNRRKFDKSRLKFFLAEADEELTKLYIVPQGVKITQVLSETEAQSIIKGEELEKKTKELFPPKKKSE